MKRFLSLSVLFLIFLLTGCRPTSPSQSDDPLQILFIGNSYTFVNEMPEVFAELAELGDHEVNVTMLAKAGFSLNDHAQDPETRKVLDSQSWDYVILQEKSNLPILDKEEMAQGIRQLNELTAAQGTKNILFMPWAYRDGFPAAELEDYQAMQSLVANAYLAVAADFELSVAPVGIVWQAALERDPQLDLWSSDGSHPSPLGSYLAANVFYALIFSQSPVGKTDFEGAELTMKTEKLLQEITADLVLEDPVKWNP